ncbi:MAG: ABC transporter ATP-binding protein, partial [Solobacterium sp.]|nr:ABC transporter ATP-binding protein [Solobacterium sp.]
NGTSTARYSDRDWDAYRNHTIGFVFQSYNLIPHQTLLENVELALTIGGISRRERRKRAMEALEQVGLAQHMHKRPNQLSGGQMQRVAIARGLVNNPDILLADEPTGALDSTTSIQVMDLLKEVAKDRLVVMVTHNPELAEQYANRIVSLKDGEIISDSNPYLVEEGLTPPVHRKLGHASMSFATALSLSFNNLRSKLGRTLMVAFAGSIGIIGIALIMSLSNGVSAYISDIESQTSSEYPITIQRQAFSLSTMMEAQEGPVVDYSTAEVKEMQTLTRMFSQLNYNDLESLKTYLDSDESGVYEYASSVEYGYNVTPQIFRLDGRNVRKVNPDSTFSSMGFGSSMFSFSGGTFNMMPRDRSLYLDQYEIKAGRWPTGYGELVVVLTSGGYLSDLDLYSMGLKDSAVLDEMLKEFSKGEEVEVRDSRQTYRYEDLIGLEFKLVNSCQYYRHDSSYNAWIDESDDPEYLYDLVSKGETLKVVGVVQPSGSGYSNALYTGIGYLPELKDHVIGESTSCEVTRAQLAAPDTNVMTGSPFGERNTSLDLGNLFTVNTAAMEKAFSFDTSALSLDTSAFEQMDFSNLNYADLVDPSAMTSAMSGIDPAQLTNLLLKIRITATSEDLQKLLEELSKNYLEYASKDPSTDYSSLGTSMQEYLQTPEAAAIISNAPAEIWNSQSEEIVNRDLLRETMKNLISGYVQYAAENPSDDTDASIDAYLDSPQAAAILAGFLSEVQTQAAQMTISEEAVNALLQQLSDGYTSYAQDNNLPDPEKFNESFNEYLNTEEAQALILSKAASFIDTTDAEKEMQKMMNSLSSTMAGAIGEMMGSAMEKLGPAIVDNIQKAMSQTMNSMSSSMTN